MFNQRQSGLSRRSLIKRAAAVAAMSGLPAWFLNEMRAAEPAATPLAANDKPSVALIGCGNRGTAIGKEAAKLGNIVAVCEVDSNRLAAAAKTFAGATAYSDFRKAIAHKGVDLVVNGTPDHWHTLINIHAMRQGKDVYGEKPLTLTISEGRKLVNVSKETNRILQTGSQQRSDGRFRLACELVRNGRLGKLQHVGVYLPAGLREGPFPTAPVPPELDWEFWQGQAPWREYVPQRVHRFFRNWYEYSEGTLTDWGAHHHDIALWAMGMDRSGPVEIDGKSLVEQIPGGYSAASQYRIEYTYANGVKLTTRSTVADGISGAPVKEEVTDKQHHGIRFEGSDGWIFVTRGKLEASDPELIKKELPEGAQRLYVSTNHMGNFFECAKTRKQPICEAEVGHRAVSVCHLGSISIRLGRKVKWDPQAETFPGDAEANAYLTREMRKPWSYEAV